VRDIKPCFPNHLLNTPLNNWGKITDTTELEILGRRSNDRNNVNGNSERASFSISRQRFDVFFPEFQFDVLLEEFAGA
jgi:hypothetical protein